MQTDKQALSPRPWRRISRRILAANKWWRYMLDDVELPDGSTGEYHCIETPGSVMTVPLAANGRLLLVRQYRYPNARISIEFPGGGVDPGADAESAAARELREEAGVSAGELIFLGSYNPWNGVTSELCSVYLAHSLQPCEPMSGAGEECVPMYIDAADFEKMAADGDIWDGQTLAAWTLYTAYRGRSGAVNQ